MGSLHDLSRSGASVIAACVTALLPRVASAQDSPTLRGFELSTSVGYARFLSDAPGPYKDGSGALALDAHLGFRVSRRTAFGLHLAGNFLATSRDNPDTDATGLAAGLYLRFYVAPHPERLGWDPWIGLDFDIIARIRAFDDVPRRTLLTYETVAKGSAATLRVGLDYRITDRLAVGAHAAISAWLGDDICATSTTASMTYRYCFHDAPNWDYYDDLPTAAVSWALALNVRYFLPR